MKFIDYAKLMRLNKPFGITLLFLPCLFGVVLTIKQLEEINYFLIQNYIALFFVGSGLMRSAGCVINDLFDEKFDQKVARTKARKIASKEVSKVEALMIIFILLSFSLAILLQFNYNTILCGVFSLLLVVLYPLMKRITYYPQLFLGLTFNIGIIIASLAIVNKITFEALILYLAAIIWTLIYDTIYGFQDIEDDMKIGVKSTSIKFRDNPKRILLSLNFIMFVVFIFLGYIGEFKPGYFIVILLLDLYLNCQIKKIDFKNPKSCLKAFKKNFWAGLLILLALILA